MDTTRPGRHRPAVALAAAALLLSGCTASGGAVTVAGSQPAAGSSPAGPGAADVSAPTTIAAPVPAGGVIAFRPLEASGRPLPLVHVPQTPDPAAAQGLPDCRLRDLEVATSVEGVMHGTMAAFVTLTARPGVHCRLSGRPGVRVVARPVVTKVEVLDGDVTGAGYEHPVAVDAGHPAVVAIGWDGTWCGKAFSLVEEHVTLPAGGGTFRIPALGRTHCDIPDAVAPGHPDVLAGAFQPQTWTAADDVSPLADVAVDMAGPGSVAAGDPLGLVVTLTAAHDVGLAECPDYVAGVYAEQGHDQQRYALDCAAVPDRDPSGAPMLRAGVPVRFAVRLTMPFGVPSGTTCKTTFQLDPDRGPAMADATTVA